MIKKEVIVSGIRSSGKLHIGNYLGALKQYIELQNEQDKTCYFFIADLHSLTTPFDSKTLSRDTLDITASYLAAGINPDKCVFFLQSHILEHAQLAWVFNCLLPLGELERMTQYKDKTKQHAANINAGLLTYPALMAADILMYKANAVPVGEDQTQHVELARLMARKFNNKFGKTFPEPRTFLRKPIRIMSLADPAKKMSKTPHQSPPIGGSGTGQAGDDGALFLDDSPKEIHRKLKKAVTASVVGQKSPGEENLMLLLSNFGTDEEVRNFMRAQSRGILKYSELKEVLAKDIAEYFSEFREKKKVLLAKPNHLKQVLDEGSATARKVASETLKEVKEKIGLL